MIKANEASYPHASKEELELLADTHYAAKSLLRQRMCVLRVCEPVGADAVHVRLTVLGSDANAAHPLGFRTHFFSARPQGKSINDSLCHVLPLSDANDECATEACYA